jgi:hypothetical protein
LVIRFEEREVLYDFNDPYYILVARAGLDRFIPWTVAGRYYAAAFIVLMVVSGESVKKSGVKPPGLGL